MGRKQDAGAQFNHVYQRGNPLQVRQVVSARAAKHQIDPVAALGKRFRQVEDAPRHAATMQVRHEKGQVSRFWILPHAATVGGGVVTVKEPRFIHSPAHSRITKA